MNIGNQLGAIALVAGLAVTANAVASTSVSPEAVVFNEDGAVTTPLTATPGDPEAGKEWFADRKLGNCLTCHQVSDLADQPFHGEVGPVLDGVADRWDEASLRGIVVNSKVMFDGTIMPAFYSLEVGERPREEYVGKPILTDQQVEDVVAYLKTLTE